MCERDTRTATENDRCWRKIVLKEFNKKLIGPAPTPAPHMSKCKGIMGDFQLVSIVQVKRLSKHTYKVQSTFTVFSGVLIFVLLNVCCVYESFAGCPSTWVLTCSPFRWGFFFIFFLQLSTASSFPGMGVSGDKCTTRMLLVSKTTFSGVELKTRSHFPVEVITKPHQILDLI